MNVVFVQDPAWEGGSQPFRDVLRDTDGNIITLNMDFQIQETGNIKRYTLPRTDFNTIVKIADEVERNILEQQIEIEKDERQEEIEEDIDQEQQHQDEQQSDHEEEQQHFLNRRERRNKGNNYASILASLL